MSRHDKLKKILIIVHRCHFNEIFLISKKGKYLLKGGLRRIPYYLTVLEMSS